MRITRAALRAGKIHEDDEETNSIPSTTPPPAAQADDFRTPKAVFQDITTKNTSTPGLVFRQLKFIEKQKVEDYPEGTASGTAASETFEAVDRDVTSKELVLAAAPEARKLDVEVSPQAAESPEDVKNEELVPQTPKVVHQNTTSKYALIPAIVHKTPKFDPEIHQEIEEADAGSGDSTKEDSFVEHIIARSPVKPVPRIEDSVEAMDALEDAIEQVSQTLPIIEEMEVQSPVRSRKNNTTKSTYKTPADSLQLGKMPGISLPKKTARVPKTTATTPKKVAPALQKTPSLRIAAAVRKSSPTKKVEVSTAPPGAASTRMSTANYLKRTAPVVKAAAGRPSTFKEIKRPFPTVKTIAKPVAAMVSSPKPKADLSASKPQSDTMQKAKISVSLSTSKPGFVIAKSSKPTTTSSFTLPGEAVAARLKTQREERQKREEETVQVKKDIKLKPFASKPLKAAPMPRQTKTSQARLSMMNGGNREIIRNVPKNDSRLSLTKTRGAVPAKANSGIRRTTIIPSGGSTHGASIAPVAEKQVDPEELRARTKKAREEAAEKGRIASREWAEKQKRKSMGTAVKTRVSSDKAADAVAA